MKSRVVSKHPPACMSSQYRCWTTQHNTAHIVHEVYVWDINRERQPIRALIECGTTSIFMVLRLLRRLGLPSGPVHITTLDLDSHIMILVKHSGKMTISCQYFEYSALVDKLDDLVVPMMAYNSVLSLPWFQSRNPESNWFQGQLLGL